MRVWGGGGALTGRPGTPPAALGGASTDGGSSTPPSGPKFAWSSPPRAQSGQRMRVWVGGGPLTGRSGVPPAAGRSGCGAGHGGSSTPPRGPKFAWSSPPRAQSGQRMRVWGGGGPLTGRPGAPPAALGGAPTAVVTERVRAGRQLPRAAPNLRGARPPGPSRVSGCGFGAGGGR
jgi:hypothetical protein